MSAPTDEHREAGRNLWELCLNDGTPDAGHLIAIALADFEAHGMKRGLERAAEIADDVGNFGDYQRHELSADFGQPRFDMMHQIKSRILSEINPSARFSSRASEAGSSDTSTGDPAAIHEATK